MVLSCTFCTFSAILNFFTTSWNLPFLPFILPALSAPTWRICVQILGAIAFAGLHRCTCSTGFRHVDSSDSTKVYAAGCLLRSRRAEMMDGKCLYADSRRRRKSNTFQQRGSVALHSIWPLRSYRGAETHMKKNAGCHILNSGLPENLHKLLQQTGGTLAVSSWQWKHNLHIICIFFGDL